MKYIKKWDIVFDKNCYDFYPGDRVRGKMVVDIENTLAVTKIEAKFKGKAEVTLFIGDYDTQKINYFNHEKVLYKCPDDVESEDFKPGHYEYPFQFTLPLGLPYSFSCEGDESGVVAYFVRVTIHRPNKYTYVYDKPFNVLGVLDLKTVNDAEQSTSNTKMKIIKCFFCKSGIITATIDLPKKGYVAGEEILLHAIITNGSARRIKNTEVVLMQRITLRVYGSSTLKMNKISKWSHGPVPSGGMETWLEEPLLIPAEIPPTTINGCELMDVEYSLELVVTPAGLSRKMRIPVDIIVGTVPLAKGRKGSRKGSTVSDKEASSGIFDHGSCV